jgi:hypothetical protein
LNKIKGLSKKHGQPFFITFEQIFSNEKEINSSFFNYILPILKKIKCKILLSAKINLLYKTNNNIEHGFHVDYEDKENLKTAVYYLNTNNGYTKFINNKKIKSEKNKIVIFDSNILHTGSSCTDEEFRICLNINYYE